MIDKINIPQYIHDLLHEYSSVIVPGLGAFSTRYKHAEIDGNVNHIQPPIKTIEFNERLKINDGLLVGRIAQAEKVSGFEVTKIVDDFVKQSHEKLDRGQAISLPKIGELRKDGEGNMSFSPFAGQNYATDTHGLGASDLPDDLLDEPFEDTEFVPPFAAESEGYEASNSAYKQEVQEEKPRKKTVSSVLAQNMKNGEGEPVGEPVDGDRRGGAFWILLPLLIAGLFLMLLYQLGSSDRSWKETKPFSYVFGSGDNTTTTLADGDAAYVTDEIGIAEDDSEYGTEDNDEDAYNSDVATDEYGTDNDNNDEYIDTNEGFEANEGASNEEPSDPYGEDENNDTGYDGGIDNNEDDFDATGGRDDAYNDSDEYNNDNNDDYTAAPPPPPPPPPKRKPKPKPKPKPRPVATSSTVVEGMKITKSGLNEYVNTAAPQGYYVIVGAFKSRANAGKLAAKLRRDGLGSYILQTTSGYYRTGIYVPSGIATVREQYALAQQRYNKGAWVLQYK